MRCPTCGHNNKPTANFCSACGAEVSMQPIVSLLPPGTLLQGGAFKIFNKLGEGGMGAVYLAEMQPGGQFCAIKEMRDSFSDPGDRQEAVRSFQREITILQSLYHVSIPEFYQAFTEKQKHYLVIEYVEGHDLEQGLTQRDQGGNVVRRGQPFPWQQVVKYAIQICDVLIYLHGHKPDPIVYRDMKPANVLVTKDGRRLVLTDFGIARFFAPRTKGTAIGTPGYIPPEQYTGMVEPRSDLYALAATMHHLLTDQEPGGFPPFKLPHVSSLVSNVPRWLDDIIAVNLREEVSERYDSAQQLRGDLMRQQVTKTAVCAKCGHRNLPGSAYCDRCAHPLSQATVSCRNCGTANVINSQFCISCGQPV